ncbi:MAG: carboxypeptidase regulatory-like domain-containing protein, partial [Micavibrio aeruginosavorus]|nr:carboxypeptidase regulatory-like domain-containing protein [Micavibrio aeruginosavorus]
TVDGRGEYRFEDVRLNFGNNQIRRVLYGPQGQVREQVDDYVFGANMLRPGQFDYTVGAVDAEKDLIRLREDPNSDNKIHGLAAGAEAAYGLHRNVTVYGGVSTLPVKNNESEDEIRDYLSAGTALSLPFGVAQAEAYQDVSRDKDVEKKGRALDARFITEILGFKLNLRSAFFNDFESPDSGFGRTARKFLGEAGIQRTLQLPFAQLSLGMDYDHDKNVDGNTRTSLSARQSISRGGTRLSNNITTNWTNGKQSSSSGQLSASARIKQVRLRTNLNYDIKPIRQLSSMDGELRYSPTDRLSTALTVNHNLLESTTGAGLQLSYDFDRFLASIEGNWQQDQGFTFGVRASSSLGPYGPGGRYMMRAERFSSASPVAGRADENGNVTSFEGGGIEEANIEVDRSSLLDPYHMPSVDGYTTTLRPGSMPYFEFPVIETGAIDGTALRDNGDPLQGMRLELVNAKGEVVAKTETAYDGFYTFEYVPPGQYTVRADPSYEVNVPPQSVAVSSEELFASGIDLQLLEQAVEAEAEEADAGALGEADVTAAPESGAS